MINRKHLWSGNNTIQSIHRKTTNNICQRQIVVKIKNIKHNNQPSQVLILTVEGQGS